MTTLPDVQIAKGNYPHAENEATQNEELETLREENTYLQKDKEDLEKDLEQNRKELNRLGNLNREFIQENVQLERDVKELTMENNRLKSEVSALERVKPDNAVLVELDEDFVAEVRSWCDEVENGKEHQTHWSEALLGMGVKHIPKGWSEDEYVKNVHPKTLAAVIRTAPRSPARWNRMIEEYKRLGIRKK